MAERIQRWAGRLKHEVYALYLAYGDPRTPWYARVLALVVVGYALSPVDLIPDFIPIVGYLDDLLIVPAGIALTIRLIPDAVLDDAREKAREISEKPVNRAAAVVVVGIWVMLGALAVWMIARAVR